MDEELTMKEWEENGFIYQQFLNKSGELVYQRTMQSPYPFVPHVKVFYQSTPNPVK